MSPSPTEVFAMTTAAEAQPPGLEHLQLKDRVYQHLRQGIINGDYEIGVALREVDIANRLGVSKTPVREAFVRLEKDRLVHLIPYRGATVASYTATDLKEIYEVRQLVQGACARRAARFSDASDHQDLDANLDATRVALANGDVDTVIKLFDAFDQLIYKHSHNRWIDDLVRNLDGHQRRIGRLTVKIPGRMDRSLGQHVRIVEAIKARDEDAAEYEMRAHVASVMADQLANFYPEQK